MRSRSRIFGGGSIDHLCKDIEHVHDDVEHVIKAHHTELEGNTWKKWMSAYMI